MARLSVFRITNKTPARVEKVLGAPVTLDKAETVIGRHPIEMGIDIPLPEEGINRRHAHVLRADDAYWVYDLRSRNGTTLNNRPVAPGAPVRLGDRDEIRIGVFVLRFRASEPGAPEAAPDPERVFGFDGRWRTTDVLGLARVIHAEQAFDLLPILSDALMDAGCTDQRILAPCRSKEPYPHGCWVVDLVLETI